MCGIAGLFTKSPLVEARLGGLLSGMLTQLSDRGPDSAGVAVYRDPAPNGWCKLSLYSPDPEQRWSALCQEIGEAFGGSPELEVRASHGSFRLGWSR